MKSCCVGRVVEALTKRSGIGVLSTGHACAWIVCGACRAPEPYRSDATAIPTCRGTPAVEPLVQGAPAERGADTCRLRSSRRRCAPCRRMLAVEGTEFPYSAGSCSQQLVGSVEEHLGGDGEELGRIRAGVRPQHRRTLGAHRVVGRGAHLDPAGPSGLVVERRRAVGDTVEHVEPMGELVVHHVLARRPGNERPRRAAAHDSTTGPW